MRKNLLTTLLCAIAGCSVYGQGFSKNIKYNLDGSERKEFINAMTYDSVSNALFFALNTQPATVAHLYKTDLDGNVTTILADTTNAQIYYGDVISSRDAMSLYWIAAGYHSNTTDSSFWKVLKTDKDLHIIWEKTYDFLSGGAVVTSIKEISNSTDLIILGYNYTASDTLGMPPTVPPKIGLLKIDSSGNQLSFHETGPANAYGTSLVCNDSNQYLVIGTYDSAANGTTNQSYLWKIDTTGNILWQRPLYGNPLLSVGGSIMKDKNHQGRYICLSQIIDNVNLYSAGKIQMVDENGITIWDKMPLPTGMPANMTALTDIVPTNDGGMIMSGVVNHFDAGGVTNLGTYGWIVKTDQNGGTLWQKPYSYVAPEDFFDESLLKITALPNGSFIAAGITYGLIYQTPDMTLRSQDGWLLKIDSSGCFNQTCVGVAPPDPVSVSNINEQQNAIRVFPNPANEQLTVVSENKEPMQITINDISGRSIKVLTLSKEASRQVLNVSHWAGGIYLAKIQTKSGYYYQKISVQH